jgi:hypothetical protein
VRTETGILLARRTDGRVNLKTIRTPYYGLQDGQVIPIYSYLGKDCWKSWIDGQFLIVCDVGIRSHPQQEWWVQIKTPGGAEAWTNSAPNAFASEEGLNSELAGRIAEEKGATQEQLAQIDALLDGGADLNGNVGKDGTNPVKAAIMKNDVDLLAELMSRGLIIGGNKSCPADFATGGSALRPGGDLMLDFLLENGMRIDCLQDPPLHAFLRYGIAASDYPVEQAARVAGVLVKHGASVNQRDSQGKSILDLIDAAKEPERMLPLREVLTDGTPQQSRTAKVESVSDVPAPRSFTEMKEQVEAALNERKYDRALLDAERAVQMYPGNDQARSLLERVRRIRSNLK